MKKAIIGVVVIGVFALLLFVANSHFIGAKVDSHNGVSVYYNGWAYGQSHGKHYDNDGYYFGHKWQCVEFIKRYYYLHLGHSFPDGWGNAKDFFDTKIAHGGFNKYRGLYQYGNGGKEDPKPDDIVVFGNGTYGHVAIVTEVGDDYVEVIQQNVFLKTRKRFRFRDSNIDNGSNPPLGWLRLEK